MKTPPPRAVHMLVATSEVITRKLGIFYGDCQSLKEDHIERFFKNYTTERRKSLTKMKCSKEEKVITLKMKFTSSMNDHGNLTLPPLSEKLHECSQRN